jgi:hypothetical protein
MRFRLFPSEPTTAAGGSTSWVRQIPAFQIGDKFGECTRGPIDLPAGPNVLHRATKPPKPALRPYKRTFLTEF